MVHTLGYYSFVMPQAGYPYSYQTDTSHCVFAYHRHNLRYMIPMNQCSMDQRSEWRYMPPIRLYASYMSYKIVYYSSVMKQVAYLYSYQMGM